MASAAFMQAATMNAVLIHLRPRSQLYATLRIVSLPGLGHCKFKRSQWHSPEVLPHGRRHMHRRGWRRYTLLTLRAQGLCTPPFTSSYRHLHIWRTGQCAEIALEGRWRG